jgi:hypothetical protein
MTNVVEMTVAAVDTPTELPRGERLIEKINMVFMMLSANRDDTAEAVLNQIFDELREMDKPETVMNGAAEILHRKITRDPNIDIVLAKVTHSDSPDCPVEYVTWIQNKDDVSRGHDGTYHGHYVPEYDMALDDFLNRQ